MLTFDAATVGRLAAGLGIGVVVGTVGTAVHRALPWGLALALASVIAVGILARAWGGGATVLATGLGVASSVALLGGRGPGGDVLVAADAVGWVWYLGAALAAVAYVVPRSWFSETEIGRRAAEPAPTDPA